MQLITKHITVIFIVLLIVFGGLWIYQSSRLQAYTRETSLLFLTVIDKVALPYRMARLSSEEPDAVLMVPIQGLPLRSIADSWGAPRSGGRLHEGIDMFAKRGTPVFSATNGYVVASGTNGLGGNVIFVMGAGGVRYYYAHLDSIAEGILFGTEVSTTTVLGFVGNSGNAEKTPSHLHFGMYKNGPKNPHDLLMPRTN